MFDFFKPKDKFDQTMYRNGTIKNKFGIKDARTLRKLEYAQVSNKTMRLKQLDYVLPSGRIIGRNGFQDVLDVHKYLFNGIYTWAGVPRDFGMSKSGHNFMDYHQFEDAAKGITSNMERVLSTDSNDLDTIGLNIAAAVLSINNMHPFREGNGRTQRLIVQGSTYIKGYFIDLDPAEDAYDGYMQASIDDDLLLMADTLRNAMIPLTKDELQERDAHYLAAELKLGLNDLPNSNSLNQSNR